MKIYQKVQDNTLQLMIPTRSFIYDTSFNAYCECITYLFNRKQHHTLVFTYYYIDSIITVHSLFLF